MGNAGRSKVVLASDAVQSITSGSTVVVAGSGGGVNDPDCILQALEERYKRSRLPSQLVLYHPNGLGDGEGRGTDRFAHEGFVRAVYGSHWSWAKNLSKMAIDGAFEVAVWPQGVLSQLLREAAAGRPGLLSEIGMGTYLDPRVPVDRMPRSVLPTVYEVLGQHYLFYRAPVINVAIIRATTADEDGNLSFEQEGVVLDALGAAMAAHQSGGVVIAQVKRVARSGSLNPLLVRVPHYLVDHIVVDPDQRQSCDTAYNPGYSGELQVAIPQREDLGVARKIIARRAALELRDGDVVNLGFGIADGVAAIAHGDPRFHRDVTFTIEQGVSGGIPAWDRDFGLMWNPQVILDAPSQFDFYDGGGLDLAIVSFAEVGETGDVNVSRFGRRLVGPGGFMNITSAAHRVVFCGTLTAKGLEITLDGPLVRVLREGTVAKFVRQVMEITFSGKRAVERHQSVLYVTERAVFRLTTEGLELVELAPGYRVDDIIRCLGFKPSVSSTIQTMPEVVFEDVLP